MAAKKTEKKIVKSKKGPGVPCQDGRTNSKSPEAAKAREKLDAKVLAKLQTSKARDGLRKNTIAELLNEDPKVIKASLTRLIRQELIGTSGETVNTVYFAHQRKVA